MQPELFPVGEEDAAIVADVMAFYRHLGYAQDEAVTFGKRLIHD